MNGRKKITVDMIEAALRKGWNANQTARHYGMHRKSIDAAAERFGIVLPLGMTWTPPQPKTKPLVVWTDEIKDKPATKPATKPVFSASKASIERALAKKAQEKRLQVMG
jgi:hypothetical protein